MISARIAYWLRYAFQTYALRRELPYLFGLVLTDKCNLDCFYCESKNTGRYHMTFQQVKDSLYKAYERGHRLLYFSGGEPMIWEDTGHTVDDLVECAWNLGFFDIYVYTNGTKPLQTKGCKYIVTVDGPREIHNSIRQGTFDLVMQHIRNAVTKQVLASITLSKVNAAYLAQYVKDLSGAGFSGRISFNLLTHCPEIMEQYGLANEEKGKLLDRIWRLKKAGYPIVLSHAAYKALKNNHWKRPIPQVELGTREKIFTCCRDVDNPDICNACGYAGCAEISQVLALKPSALWELVCMTS